MSTSVSNYNSGTTTSSSSSSTSINKLHPIYNALDHQQYNRAIKLCLQQPADNWYAQALLAHAYAKSEQRAKALQVLYMILIVSSSSSSTAAANTDTKTTKDYLVELQLAHQYAQTGNAMDSAASASSSSSSSSSPSTTTTTTTTTATTATSSKSGKKGKKKLPAAKPVAVASAATTRSRVESSSSSSSMWDWIDALDTAPVLPRDSFDAIPPWPVPLHLQDFHLIHTVHLTLLHLRCTLTAYQVYAWWAATLITGTNVVQPVAMANDVLAHLRDTFGLGLAVWMAPQYQYLPVRQSLLAALQVLALQIARFEATTTTTSGSNSGGGGGVATLWAAQTALWQCQGDDNIEVPANKMALLPRLAENLALKMVQQRDEAAAALSMDQNQTTRITAEAFLLWTRALQVQGKWAEYLQAVQERLTTADATPTLGLTPAMLLDFQSQALQQLNQIEAARNIVARNLRQNNPDQWDMWMRHLDLDDTDDYQATIALAHELTLDETEGEKRAYPRRGPPLVILEALRRRIDNASQNTKEALLAELLVQIQSYGNAFASQTACTFSDLQACLDCVCSQGGATQAAVLLPWLQTMQTKPFTDDSSARRGELRAFIFAHQTMLKLLDCFPEFQRDWLPDWKDLVCAWKEFQSFEDDFKAAQTDEERKNAQKESRPADEVILLAVQLLLAQDSSSHGRILAATLLDKAIEQSPYNAYLKLSQIFVCADLNATSRSWDLFRQLFIKHIQHESCAYLILPLLRAGGMYQEVLKVCREIIRLQITALRDANEFTGKALENGTFSQVDEFIRFQRNRMNKSLTTLEAKGLIMDCAPMFRQDDRQIEIGSMHGIVGGEEDMERVQKMISEAHNPQGTFTLLRLRGSVKDNVAGLSENRDLKALEYEVFRPHVFPTREEVIGDCIRRSYHHGLLLRASLCIDATKGPKKGKVVKPSPELAKRCKSLISRVNEAQNFAESEMKTPAGYGTMLLCMTKLCRAIAVLAGGFVGEEHSPQDSVSFREDQTEGFLLEAVETLQKGREQLNISTSASRTGQALTDVILPVLALMKMCAKINDLFGWAKKRRAIRKCAGCLYDFAMALRALLDDMTKSLENLQLENEGFELPNSMKTVIVPMVVSDEDVREILFSIHGAQGQTKTRIERILQSIRSDCESFETEE